MSVDIDVQFDGLREIADSIRGFSERRMRAVMATALTRTAKGLSGQWQKHIDTTLDQPVARTRTAVRIESANAGKLSAKVAIKDRAGSGMAQVDYLRQHEYGGGRLVKKFERALINAGAMPSGYMTVPGRGASRDGSGNVSRGLITAVISQLGRDFTPGYDRTISRDAERRARSQARHGRRYIVMPIGHPSVSPGIYERAPGRVLSMVFAFKRVVSYSRKLTLQSSAPGMVQVIAQAEFNRALSESIARLNARGAG